MSRKWSYVNILDTKTGKYYFGINNVEGDVPEALHPLIKERIDR